MRSRRCSTWKCRLFFHSGASHIWAKRASSGAFFPETLNTLLSALYVLMTRWNKDG